ncbi:hypothetical protein M0Q50_07260 [bacterium]|jgi:hypothetical protein|nr:hypothetical protein [bacterium]
MITIDNKIEKTITIDFSKKEIFQHIKSVCKVGNIRIIDNNEIFGTIKIGKSAGMLQFVNINFTISEINENKCNLSILSYSAGSSLPQHVINSNTDDFLTLLSRSLSGETITKEVVDNVTDNTFQYIATFIIIGVILYFILF